MSEPRISAPALLTLALLASLATACAPMPPRESYVSTGRAAIAETSEAGQDTTGGPCISRPGEAPVLDLPVLSSRQAFCGGAARPVARVVALRGGGEAALDQVAADGPWRRWVGERAECQAPRATSLTDGTPARLLTCTQRANGRPYLALVTLGSGGVVVADGLPNTLPVMERLARGGPVASTAGARSDVLALATSQIEARAFSSTDDRDLDEAMALGQEHNLAEDYAAAEAVYRAALVIQERSLGAGHPNTVNQLLPLAINISNQRRFPEAEGLLARAERLAPAASDRTAPARVLHYQGLHALNQGPRFLPLAAEKLDQAAKGYVALVPSGALDEAFHDAILGLSEVRRVQATVLARQGDVPGARRRLEEARALLAPFQEDRPIFPARGLRTEARLQLASGDAGRAAEAMDRSARYSGQTAPGERRAEARNLFLAGRNHMAAGNRPAALASFRAGAEILRARRITLEPDLVVSYLDALSAAGLDSEMFGAAQLTERGQTARFIAEAAARLAERTPEGREAIRKKQEIDRALPLLYAERGRLGDASPEARAELDARIQSRLDARAEADSDLRREAPGYRRLLRAGVGAEEVGRVLGPSEAMVQILLGREHGYALAVRPGGAVTARRIDLSEADAAALVRRARASIDARAVNQVFGAFDVSAAQMLYQKLLAPVEQALAGIEALVVIPDGPLLSLPFGLLLTGPAEPAALREAPWLIKRFTVAHATSAQALVTVRAEAPASSAPNRYIGFGDFEPPSAAQWANRFPTDTCGDDAVNAAQLRRLQASRFELLAAATHLQTDRRALNLGPAFTLAALRQANLGSYRIIHLATHGLLPAELKCLLEPAVLASVPRNAASAEAAFLGAREISTMRLDADLVILSACNTAGPAEGAAGAAGEALSGLAQSFFWAGARGMLVTHWNVDDNAAAQTVVDTLRRQNEGASSAAALRGAQLGILEEAGRDLPLAFAHPAYWAGFALIGDGRRAPARQATAFPSVAPPLL